jgi:rod shape-determining protein MreC
MKRISQRTLRIITIGLVIVGILVMAVSGLLNQIIGKAIDPLVSIQGWFASRSQAVVEFFTIPRDVATLRQENAALKNQISQLQSELLEARQRLTETDILYALLDYARAKLKTNTWRPLSSDAIPVHLLSTSSLTTGLTMACLRACL